MSLNSSDTLNDAQKKALAKIAALARDNNLDAPLIADALLFSTSVKAEKAISGNFLTGLLGYLGGALIVSGLFIYAAIVWDDIGSLPRVLLSLGSGITAFMAGAILQKDEDTRKASLPLWILSSMLIPTGLFVVLQEYGSGGSSMLGSAIVFMITAVIYGLGFQQFRLANLLFFTYAFGLSSIGTYFEFADINTPLMWLFMAFPATLVAWKIHNSQFRIVSGLPIVAAFLMLVTSVYYYIGNTALDGLATPLLLLAIYAAQRFKSVELLIIALFVFILNYGKNYAYCWGYLDDDGFRLTAACTGISMMFMAQWVNANITERQGAFWHFFGASLLFAAFMGLWMNTPFDILFPAIPAFVLYLSLKLKSRALLLSSILSLLSFISYYTATYFANVVGWPIALIVMGFILIILCRFALKMNARMKAG